MAKVVDLKSRRKKTNKETAKDMLPKVLDAIETAKRALRELYKRKKLYEQILKGE
jgi:flagellar biosynthesis chaperone FliJ